jgi:hypothetical protein
MKRVIELNHTEARQFFLKSESYWALLIKKYQGVNKFKTT